ncbi:MAG: dehydrogenase, partial [Pseudomonadota bacterium]
VYKLRPGLLELLGQFGGFFDRPAAVDPVGARDAHAQRAAKSFAHGVEHFHRKADAVFKTAAISVGALVGDGRQKLVQQIAVREAFGGTLGMRISGTDWVDGGWTVEETAELSKQLKQAGAQFVHISSGGVSPLQKIALGPEYQVHLAKAVKTASDLTTIAVGLITEPAQAEAVLQRGDADLVALARSFLYKPRWGWEAAVALGGTVDAQHQYWRSLPREAKNIFNDAKIGMR